MGIVCFVAGLGIGAGAVALAGDDETTPPPVGSDIEVGADEEDRGGHILVFLVEGVSDSERQGIEATLDARDDVEAYEYWNAEATQAEARRLFRDDPEMLAKLDGGVFVPESYRLLLRDPNRPNAMVVSSQLEGLPGVFKVVLTDSVPDLGE